MTTRTPKCSAVTSCSVISSSRNMAYRNPEQPPGCTATRRAMSDLPSWTSSSLTLPAASWVSVSIGSPAPSRACALAPLPAIIPAVWVLSRGFLELDHVPADQAHQGLGGDREHRIGGPGCRPHLLVSEQVRIEQDGQPTGMAERRSAPDDESGCVADLLRRRSPDLLSPADAGEPADIGPIGAGRERQERAAVRHEYQGLHDLPDPATDGPRRLLGRPGAFREPSDLHREPERCSRRPKPLLTSHHSLTPRTPGRTGPPLPPTPPAVDGCVPWPPPARSGPPARPPARPP